MLKTFEMFECEKCKDLIKPERGHIVQGFIIKVSKSRDTDEVVLGQKFDMNDQNAYCNKCLIGILGLHTRNTR